VTSFDGSKIAISIQTHLLDTKKKQPGEILKPFQEPPSTKPLGTPTSPKKLNKACGDLERSKPSFYQWIGLRENLQESHIFNGKICGFL
jgi:hypothetical protein